MEFAPENRQRDMKNSQQHDQMLIFLSIDTGLEIECIQRNGNSRESCSLDKRGFRITYEKKDDDELSATSTSSESKESVLWNEYDEVECKANEETESENVDSEDEENEEFMFVLEL